MTTQKKQQKHVLIVAYAFPPVGGAGVQRPAKFVKYLRDFNWEPAVLTCANPSVPVLDSELVNDLPNDIIIYKPKTLEPSYAQKNTFSKVRLSEGKPSFSTKIKQLVKNFLRNILLPDLQVLWWPGLVANLINIIKNRKPDCVFVTAPPFSSLIPTVLVCKFFKIPVVADFRDEWIFNRQHIENAARNSFAEFIDRIGERIVVSCSTAITAATSKYLQGLETRHSEAKTKYWSVITNGFDGDDFKNIQQIKIQKNSTGKISFVYTGTVWSATSLKPFIAGLKNLVHDRPELKNQFVLKIFGRVVDEEKEYLSCSELSDNIALKGYCSHESVVKEMALADVLLLTLSDSNGTENIIPAKTFEYMATKNRILAIVPNGEVKDLLTTHYPNTIFLNQSNTQSIKETLATIIDGHSNSTNTGLAKVNDSHINKFERKYLTNKLVRILNNIAILTSKIN